MNDRLPEGTVEGCVVVFAKVPGLGIAKSRIAATEGGDLAARVYGELLAATAAAVKGLRHHVAFTGSQCPSSLATVFSEASSFFEQTGETLGDRLQNAFQHLFEQGYVHVVAIGCDCPYLSADVISQGLEKLRGGADVVIGPADDGGYYLVGISPGHEDVFSVEGWGSAKVLERTLGIIRRRKWRYAMLRTLADVDTMSDYEKWKGISA